MKKEIAMPKNVTFFIVTFYSVFWKVTLTLYSYFVKKATFPRFLPHLILTLHKGTRRFLEWPFFGSMKTTTKSSYTFEEM